MAFAQALVIAATAASPSTPCDAPPERPIPEPPAASATAPRRNTATPPGTSVTLAWVLTQLVPSPEFAVGDEGAAFGLRFQVVPVLYSFGIDRRLSPWRAFVVEPLVRTSGSLELFFAPEYLAIHDDVSRRFGFRAGVRAHFPLLEKGDYLSVSLGAAYVRFAERESASYQVGAYLLYGFLGFEQSVVPALREARFISTFNVRFF
jgi:hypothetical protein